MTRLPLDFPPLVEMADRSADEYAANDTHGAIRAYARVQFARLLSDLTRPESQAVWLRWLAGRLGWTVPLVGAPEWSLRCEGSVYQLGYGRNVALFVVVVAALDRLGAVPIRGMGVPVVQCPALPNPNSADAPIRALVLAVLTVGGAA